MQWFWRILSRFYCFLVVTGFNIAPPNILFNKPKKKFERHYTVKILADKTFTHQERYLILEAAHDLEKFCNGLIKFFVYFDLDVDNEMELEHLIVIRAKVNHPAIIDADQKALTTVLGLCAYIDENLNIIYLVHERLHNPIIFRTTTIHEIGHYLGLNHIERDSVMHKANYKSVLYPTYKDAQEFARVYKCSPEDLVYFKL